MTLYIQHKQMKFYCTSSSLIHPSTSASQTCIWAFL